MKFRKPKLSRSRWTRDFGVTMVSVIPLLVASVAWSTGCRQKPTEIEAADAADAAAKAAPSAQPSTVHVVPPTGPGSPADAVARVLDAVVNLRTTAVVQGGPANAVRGSGDRHSLGSGFVIDSDGTVATADHILASASDITAVFHDGREMSAQILGRDPRSGVALLKLHTDGPIAAVTLGDSNELRVGDSVTAVGNPFGSAPAAAVGTVAWLGQDDGSAVTGSGKLTRHGLLHLDTTIDELTAGGPVVDQRGRVIGIAIGARSETRWRSLAVPINRARDVFPILKQHGRVSRGWLGVKILPVPPKLSDENQIEKGNGALVSEVIANSPASRAGLSPGDIITELDGNAVTHISVAQRAASIASGAIVSIAFVRNGKPHTTSLTSDRMPE